MAVLVIGRPQSGKTTRVIEEVRSRLNLGHYVGWVAPFAARSYLYRLAPDFKDNHYFRFKPACVENSEQMFSVNGYFRGMCSMSMVVFDPADHWEMNERMMENIRQFEALHRTQVWPVIRVEPDWTADEQSGIFV